MKKLEIMILLSAALTAGNAKAQNWDELFNQKETQKKYLVQQIAALQVYLGYVKKGYEIAQKGLTMVGEIKKENFNLHLNYFESLEQVNPVLLKSPKAAYILALHKLILNDIESQYENCRNDENFTAAEVQYFSSVYANLKKECDASVSDLMRVLTDRELQMNDDQRIANIDIICDNMKDMYAFIRSFDPRLLALQRSLERSGLEAVEKMSVVEP
jgi:hypothetical protein